MSEALFEGKQVKQALTWVSVPAVAGIDHLSVAVFRGEIRSTRHRMAHDKDVGADRSQGTDRVDQGFAFFNTGPSGCEVDYVRAQDLTGKLERCPGTGGSLVA